MTKSFTDAILAAERHSTKKEKFDALSGLTLESQRLIIEANNPYRVFNVRKWNDPASYSLTDAPLTGFFDLLDNLHDRTLTGNAARHAVTVTLGQFTQRTAGVLERVIKKDLKCGANAKTFDAVYPELKIPYFDLMLCEKIEFEKIKGGITYPKYQWTFPCIAEVKYDGNRLVAIAEQGNVKYISRSGKPSDYCNELFDEELGKLERLVGEPIIVDGEALALSGFQGTAKSKGSTADKSNLRFFAFDWMKLSEWIAQDCQVLQCDRTQTLEHAITQLGLTLIIKTRSTVLHDLNEAQEFYSRVIESGLPGQDEGLIIKRFNGVYEWNAKKRTGTWSKWKPVIDVDLTIVGVYEGSKGTKNESRLGGFIVEGEDENGTKVKSRCGGFKISSKKFREWFTKFDEAHELNWASAIANGISTDEFFRTIALNHPEIFIGQTCLIETQELSQAEGSTTHALRFPQFIMLRDDK